MKRIEEQRGPESAGGAEDDTSDGRTPAAKPYHTPRLTSYGRLADLTRFDGSVPIDSGGGLGEGT